MTPARQRALVIGLIVIGVLIVGFFGLRTLRAFREFRGHRPPRPFDSDRPRQTDVELIRDWMTIPFIEHTYGVSPRIIFDALEIHPRGNQDKSIKQLNDEYFPSQPGYVLEAVKAAVLANLPPAPVPSAAP
jgi:hypothetical protein